MDSKTNGANNWDPGQDSGGIIIDSARIIVRVYKITLLTKSVFKIICPFYFNKSNSKDELLWNSNNVKTEKKRCLNFSPTLKKIKHMFAIIN